MIKTRFSIPKLPSNLIAEFIYVFLALLAITSIILRQRLIQISDTYGMPDVDMDGTISYLWLKTYLLLNNKQDFIDTMLGYPFGFDFSYLPFKNHVTDFFRFLLVIFGNDYSNILLFFNLVMLTTYPMSGAFTYLLLRKLGITRLASFIGCISFAFSYQYLTSRSGVMIFGIIQTIPLLVLLLINYIQKPSTTGALAFSVVFGVFFGIDTYYSFFTALFVAALFFILTVFRKIKLTEALLLALFSVLFIALLNIEFLFSNLHLANNESAKAVGRVPDPGNTFLNLKSYFFPANYNFAWGWLKLEGASILPFSGLLLVIYGFIKVKFNSIEKKQIGLLLFLMFVGIALSCQLPFLEWLNAFYFKYFYLFRSVGRFQIFVGLFFSILFSICINKIFFTGAVSKRTQYLVAILISLILVYEGTNTDPVINRITNLKPVKEFHENLASKTEPYAVLGIPTYYPGFETAFYQRLGQMFHHAHLYIDLDPKSEFSNAGHLHVNIAANILEYAKKYKFDTIYIHNKLMTPFGGQKIYQEFIKEKDLEYLGTFQSDVTPNSGIHVSMDISAFRIKENWNKNRQGQKNPIIDLNGSEIKFKKIDMYRYSFELNQNASGNLQLREPYSKAWKLEFFDSLPSKFSQYSRLGSYINSKDSSQSTPAHSFHPNDYTNIWSADSFTEMPKIALITLSHGLVREVSDLIFYVTLFLSFLFLMLRSTSGIFAKPKQ